MGSVSYAGRRGGGDRRGGRRGDKRGQRICEMEMRDARDGDERCERWREEDGKGWVEAHRQTLN